MAAHKKTVVVGIVGSQLDLSGKRRWQRWRPSVDVCRQDFVVDRFDLLYVPSNRTLAEIVKADIIEVSPQTQVELKPLLVDDPWDFEAMYDALFAVARDAAYDADREDLLVHITTGTHVAQICLFLLTSQHHLPGRLLQASPLPMSERAELGAHDRIAPGPTHIIDLDLSRYDRIVSRQRVEQLEGEALLKAGIHTRDAAYNALIGELEHVATRSRAPLLLTGETGVGKTQLARRVFELKRARQGLRGSFVEVNCATLVGDGAMSTLFGHKKGAFTGAQDKRTGVLKSADGGMLFLDEIGELGLLEQAMLLRALEDKRFMPLGADSEVSSDFMLIAGTNRSLADAVARGTFREDLLARIDLWTFGLPPLRQRLADIAPNIDHELVRASGRLGQRVTFLADAHAHYLRFAESTEATWRGNFRELSASIERMATLCDGRIDKRTVEREIARLRAAWQAFAVTPSTTPAAPATMTTTIAASAPLDVGEQLLTAVLGEGAASIDRFDRLQLIDVLKVCANSRSLSEAGRALFAESRKHRTSTNDADRLRKYLSGYGVHFDDVHAHATALRHL